MNPLTTMSKVLIKNRTKKKHRIIYPRHQNHRVDQVFRVGQWPVEQATLKEDPDMKYLFDQLLKVTVMK